MSWGALNINNTPCSPRTCERYQVGKTCECERKRLYEEAKAKKKADYETYIEYRNYRIEQRHKRRKRK